MEREKIVVCSAWPYVNNVPHLGTLIGSILSADVYARYAKLRGHDVVYVTGSDEHGTPIEVEAKKKGVQPKELTDKVHEYVSRLFREFHVEFSLYTRTESEVHKEFVREFLMKIYENGYIYEQEEVLPYCPNCSIFLPDRFIEGTCPYCGYEKARGDQCDNCGRLLHPTELVNPHCVFCGSKPVYKKTKHWFFDLRKVESRVREWLEKSSLAENVKKFSLNWVKEGLRPRSITRDNKWGIPAPFPGAEGKTVYVWFDALLGYISATKEYGLLKGDKELWKKYWLDNKTKTIYFIGKDNIPFHAVIFPAMLLAHGGGYVLPWQIPATEYLLFEEEKFSKSRGIGVWIDEALEILPADYWRFALVRMRPEHRDSNFTWKEFYRIVNSEMNDDIGNLVHRILSFIYRRYDGVVPEPSDYKEPDKEILAKMRNTPLEVAREMDSFRLKTALEKILELARSGNQYLNIKAPWDKIKTEPGDAATTMYIGVNLCRELAILLEPFIPASAEKLWEMINLDGSVHKTEWDNAGELVVKPGHKINKPEPLFTKLSEDFLDKIDKILEEARNKAQQKRPDVLR